MPVAGGDALLTRRAIASYVVARQAHYHFTVKGNQPGLESEIALLFQTCGDADFFEVTPPYHGRIETRSIWCSAALNGYLDFPSVGQVFRIERETIDKKTGARSRDRAGNHEPYTARGLAATPAGRQPRPLEQSKAFIT